MKLLLSFILSIFCIVQVDFVNAISNQAEYIFDSGGFLDNREYEHYAEIAQVLKDAYQIDFKFITYSISDDDLSQYPPVDELIDQFYDQLSSKNEGPMFLGIFGAYYTNDGTYIESEAYVKPYGLDAVHPFGYVGEDSISNDIYEVMQTYTDEGYYLDIMDSFFIASDLTFGDHVLETYYPEVYESLDFDEEEMDSNPIEEVYIHNESTVDLSDVSVIDSTLNLSEEEIDSLNTKLDELRNTYQMGVYIRIYDSYIDAGFDSIQAYSEYIYHDENLGFGTDQDGLLLLLTMNEREYDLTAYGLGNDAFTDYGRDKLVDHMIDDLSDDRMYDAMNTYSKNCNEYLSLYQKGTPYDVGVKTKAEKIKLGLILEGVALLVTMLIMWILVKQLNTTGIATKASAYEKQGSFNLQQQSDQFTHTTTTKRYSPQNKDNNRGGSSVNSRGHSHTSGHF